MMFSTNAFAQTFEWATCSGENALNFSNYNKGKSINTDAQGNVYIVGEFGSTTNFGAYQITSAVNPNTFIAKFNNDGVVQWVDSFGSTSSTYPDAISKQNSVTDAAGNTYISLGLTSSGKIGGTDYTAGSYLIKYDTNGSITWVKTNSQMSGYCLITLDSSEDLILCGASGIKFKIAKFSKDGVWDWSISDDAGLINVPTALHIDATDNIYISGGCPMFAGNISGNAIAVGNYFLAKYNFAGSFLWVRTSSGSGYETGLRVDTDGSGNVYVTGTQNASPYTGGTADATYGTIDITGMSNFLLKYDPNGNIQWGEGFTGTNTSVRDMGTDSNGNCILTGWFQSVTYFESETLTGDIAALGTTFIVKYDASGSLGWATTITGYNRQEGLAIAVDNSNNAFITGHFLGEAIFGSITLKQVATIGAYGFAFLTKLGTTSGSSVPVELALFNATSTDGQVMLTWNTLSETNNYGFEIQRSPISTPDWQTIGFVNGNETTTEPHFYQYVDELIDVSPSTIHIQYRLKQLDTDGSFTYSQVQSVNLLIPATHQLLPNYPNPFNPVTQILFAIAAPADISISVFNINGKLVKTLYHQFTEAGNHLLQWDASDLTSGVYFIKLSSDDFTTMSKCTLIK